MKARRKYLIGIAVVLAMLWPIKTLSAPAWDVTVVDKSGVPVAGITVRESYQNYSAESTGHEEDQQTDIQGEAKFTRKTLSASLLQRVLGLPDRRQVEFMPASVPIAPCSHSAREEKAATSETVLSPTGQVLLQA